MVEGGEGKGCGRGRERENEEGSCGRVLVPLASENGEKQLSGAAGQGRAGWVRKQFFSGKDTCTHSGNIRAGGERVVGCAGGCALRAEDHNNM